MLLLLFFLIRKVWEESGHSKRHKLESESPGWYQIHIISQDFDFRTHNSLLNTYSDVLAYDNFITSDMYLAYLSENHIKSLNSDPNFEIHPASKDISCKDTDKIKIVKACSEWNPDYQINKLTENLFEIHNFTKTDLLHSDPCVLTCKPQFSRVLHNRYNTGYLQSNENKLTHANSEQYVVPKSLNTIDITGKNQIISFIDKMIDYNHDLLTDPLIDVQTIINQTNNNHRKIVRIETDNILNVSRGNGHGTHVVSSALGKSTSGSSITSLYEGIAPEAKLYFHDIDLLGSKIDISDIIEQMKTLNSGISSNSWGFQKYENYLSNYYNSLAYNNSDILFVFSAGNMVEDMSINSPADAKNVLTVGATKSPSISTVETPSKQQYYVTNGTFSIPVTPNQNLYQNNSIFTDITRFLVTNSCETITNSLNDYDVFIYYNSHCENQNPKILKSDEKYSETLKKFQKISLVVNSSETHQIKPINSSSSGPSAMGISKPEIAAPGENVISAKSGVHSTNFSALTTMTGTSMSTAYISGAAALIRQFFADGKYNNTNIKPSSSLMKAALINSAEQLNDEGFVSYKTGFGIPKLINSLTSTESRSLYYLDNVAIQSSDSHVYEINLTKKSNLSVTMSYLDPPISDSYALYADVSIILQTPDTTLAGNELINNTEESFSTTERIFIKDAKEGIYKLHVYSNDFESRWNFNISYALAISGGFSNITKVKSECPRDCKGTCHERCECDRNSRGYLCQTSIESTKVNTSVLYESQPRIYSWFRCRIPAEQNYTIKVTFSQEISGRICIVNDSINAESFCQVFFRQSSVGIFNIEIKRDVLVAVQSFSPSPQTMKFFNGDITLADLPDPFSPTKSKDFVVGGTISTSVIIVIVFATIIVVGLIAAFGFFMWRRRIVHQKVEASDEVYGDAGDIQANVDAIMKS